MIDLKKILSDKESIAISAHIRPDGDAFGSTLAMYNYIKKKYPDKQTDIYLLDPNPLFAFLPGYEDIKTEPSDKKYDLFIVMDMGDPDRLGKNRKMLDTAGDVMCVDHHLNYKNLATEANSYVVPDASSTAELVYDLVNEDLIDDDIAKCIFTGIICDTGVFQYSCTSPETMRRAAELMEYDFDHSALIQRAFYEKTYLQTQILGRCLMESVRFMDGKCVVSWIDRKTQDFYQVTSKDFEGIVSQLRNIRGVDVSIFMYETENQEYKVSMRSSEKVNVAQIAVRFGGGGHARAAGCTMSGTVYDCVNNLSKYIDKQLNAGPEGA